MTISVVRIQRKESERTVILFVNKLINPVQFNGLVVVAESLEQLRDLINLDRGTLWLVPADPTLEIDLLPWPNDGDRPVADEAYQVYSYGLEKVILVCFRHWDYYSSDSVDVYDNLEQAIEEYVEE